MKAKEAIPPEPPGPEPGPWFFRDILGQTRAVGHLQTAMARGRLSHAYLFLGPEGVGKACVARAVAAALNCQQLRQDGDACGACPSCRRLMAGTHPDFLIIAPDIEANKLQIKIEKVRELRRLTEYPPLGDGWRVVLIKPAEALNALNDAAANALLKTLEEPPERHLFVLIAVSEADLLPTIVSRCHRLILAPLPLALIAGELMRRRGLAPPQAALVAALSRGSLGRALNADLHDLLRQRQQVLADLAQLTHGSTTAMLDWAQRLAKNRGDLETFLAMARLWCRDVLLCHFQAPAHLLTHQDLLPELARQQTAGPPELWFQRFTALSAAQRQLQANRNPELTLDIMGWRFQG
jgi:DNA polymerase-3 subunit delta'